MRKVGDLGKKGDLICTVKSSSSDEMYELRLYKGNYTCTCIGYEMNKGKPKRCKHVKGYLLSKLQEVM